MSLRDEISNLDTRLSNLGQRVLKLEAGLRAMTDDEEPWRRATVGGKPVPVTVETGEIGCDAKPEIQGPPMVGDVVESRSGRIMNVLAVCKDEAWIQNENYRDVTYIHNLEIISRPEPKVGDVFEYTKLGKTHKCSAVSEEIIDFDAGEWSHDRRPFMQMLFSGEIKCIYRSKK